MGTVINHQDINGLRTINFFLPVVLSCTPHIYHTYALPTQKRLKNVDQFYTHRTVNSLRDLARAFTKNDNIALWVVCTRLIDIKTHDVMTFCIRDVDSATPVTETASSLASIKALRIFSFITGCLSEDEVIIFNVSIWLV